VAVQIRSVMAARPLALGLRPWMGMAASPLLTVKAGVICV
jgi:hypothetical protein